MFPGAQVKGLDVVMSSARTGNKEADAWRTPSYVLDTARKVAPIELDPCTSEDNPTDARRWLTEKDDGLTTGWGHTGLVFLNPPYSRMLDWARKLAAEVNRTGMKREYIALLPVRTDTKWWGLLAATRPVRVCFWKGRIRFDKPDGTPGASAPFPSAVLYWGADDAAFARAFGPMGWIVRG